MMPATGARPDRAPGTDPGGARRLRCAAPRPFDRLARRRGAAILALVALTCAAFSPLFDASFHYLDDPAYVTGNPEVLRGLGLKGLLWAGTSFKAANWHPLAWVSHMTDVSLFGLRAGAHHGMNIAIHALAAVFLLLALERMTGALWPSFLAAALFALHPLRVESVAWISERKDVLAGLFGTTTLLAYLRYLRGPRPGRYLAVAAVFALGLMAKPTLVTLPFVLLLLDWWPLGRSERAGVSSATAWGRLLLEKAPLLTLSAASAALTYHAQQQGGAVVSTELFSLAARFGNAVVSYVGYLGKALWPRQLIPFYPHPGTTLSAGAVALSLALLAGVTLVAWASRRGHPWLLVGWLWYLGTLVPMLGLVQVGLQGMADRYTYWPGIGLAIALCSEIGSRPRPRRRIPQAAGALALLSLLALLTWRQSEFWKDTVTLLERMIRVDGRNYFAYNMLGANYLSQGETGKALPLLVRALELRPEYYVARYNLGLALAATGRKEEALAQFAAVIRFNPRDAESLYNHGRLLLESGMAAEALRDFAAAIAVDPDVPELHLARQRALEILGDRAGADRKRGREEPPQTGGSGDER